MSGLAAECGLSTDEAFRTLEEAEAIAVAAGLLVEQSRIHHLGGNLFFPLGNIDDCAKQHDLALRCPPQARSSRPDDHAHENFRPLRGTAPRIALGRFEWPTLTFASCEWPI